MFQIVVKNDNVTRQFSSLYRNCWDVCAAQPKLGASVPGTKLGAESRRIRIAQVVATWNDAQSTRLRSEGVEVQRNLDMDGVARRVPSI